MDEALGDRLRGVAARYPVDEALVIGLDIGIASIGSAAVRHGSAHAIVFAGSRCFEAPEDPKTKELNNKARRDSRLLRRVTHRRARRMTDVRELLVEAGLLRSAEAEAFHNAKGAPPPDPWRARAEGLDRVLSDDEFAAALLHIAKHRGFRSNKKSGVGENAPDDESRMLSAVAANRELLARYRSVGEMVFKDGRFSENKRNKAGEFSHTQARQDLKYEVRTLYAEQRRHGNARATAELEERYIAIAFHQRPLQDSEHLVGMCPFEPAEKRSPRHAPSFERFRLLAKLNTVRVRGADGASRRLTREELGKAVADFGASGRSMSWNALATKIGLPKGVFFDGIDEKKAKADVAASKGCAAGSWALRRALGPAGWRTMERMPWLLDAVAAVIAFREDLASIERGLEELDDIEPVILGALKDGLRRGDFGGIAGAGHISAKAARNILPHLLAGQVYSDACAATGYDHTQTRSIAIGDIRNPVVQRSLREAVKQVETLIHHLGARPGRIIVELARQVGKSTEERGRMTRGIERRTAEKQQHRAELKELLGLEGEPGDEDLRRYELWKEQNYRCIYTDQPIRPDNIRATSNAVQVDHVLPRSRSQDNSHANRVLCLTGANQDKGWRTPWEWKVRDGNDHDWWVAFEARVNALRIKPYKKTLLKMRNFEQRAQGFVERNLNDTKYAARALLTALRGLYVEEGEPDPAGERYLGDTKRRLFARPGALTAILRRAWGLASVKDRSDDRHHALDALIWAAAPSEGLLNTLTRQYQQVEQENRGSWAPPVPAPWPEFRRDAIRVIESVFVSRSEKRRGRGQGHKDTIYRVGSVDGRDVTYERKAVADLTKSDLARLKDADGGNKPLAGALAAWLDQGRPKDDLVRSAKGDPVRKVYLERQKTSGFRLNGGHVDNADMVRVDVFAKPNGRGRDEFYLVPIYRHQVMNKQRWPRPPDRAIVAYKPESEWAVIDEPCEFRFSLFPDAYVEVVKRDGEALGGYFRSADRSTGALTLSDQNRREPLIRGIGAKTLRSFRKFHIDRLGRRYEIERETRTWHGAACT